ncbi:MAG: aldehyde dehydrogenase family protein, partial [Acidobacteria bacterium]|nr:aldehyde dehydrogenase family protein [Acidobacteriota bacterium]
MRTCKNYINGNWCEPVGGDWLETIDPFTQKPWALVPRCDARDVDIAVAAAKQAFLRGTWPNLSASERGKLLQRIGDLLSSNAERIGETETRDCGKRISESVPQIRATAEWFHYYG